MKRLTFALFCLLTLCFTRLFGQWELVNPYPTAEDLKSVFFLDTNNGWAVGNRGVVLHTTDGGDNWQLIQYLTMENLHDIFFCNESHGILVGEHGALFNTIDAGHTWQQKYPGTSEDLRDVSFSDENHGWIVGTGGSILRTTDGGINWLPQSGSPDVPLFSIVAVDNENGWIGGDFTALQTVDGGQNWINHYPLYGFFDSYNVFYFADELHGWVLAGVGDLLITEDGGTAWQYPGTIVPLYGNDLYFADTMQGWVVSDHGRIWHSADGGLTFSAQATFTEANLNSVFFLDGNHGWSVGEEGNIIHTSDGGETWNLQSHGLTDLFVSVCFVDHDNGWIASYFGEILHTADGGQTWEVLNTGSSKQIRDMYFTDRLHGWALRQWSSVSRTMDGGATWTTDSLADTEHWFFNIFFMDTLHGWFTSSYWPEDDQGRGAVGVLYSTMDGGVTWDSVEMGNTYPWDIFFIDEHAGWITCNDGQIMITNDGGQNWEMAKTGSTLYKTFFTGTLKGWAVGYTEDGAMGAVWQSADGGYTWNLTYQRPGAFLYSLDFPDQKIGWVAGIDSLDDRSVILRTTDGGLTWEEQAFPTRGLMDVAFTDTSNGWAVGWMGSIYHTDNGGPVDILDKELDLPAKLFKIFPNPARCVVTIEYINEITACTEIVITDMTGRKVWQYSSSREQPGRHSVQWKINVNPGMYLVRCRQSSRTIMRKILVAG